MSIDIEAVSQIAKFAFKSRHDAERFMLTAEQDAPSGHIVFGNMEYDIPPGLALIFELQENIGEWKEKYPAVVIIYANVANVMRGEVLSPIVKNDD